MRNNIGRKSCKFFLSNHQVTTALVISLSIFVSLGNGNFLRANADDVRFFLYSIPKDTDNCTEIVHLNNKSIIDSGYDKTKPLKLLIHGALSNFKTQDDVQRIKDAYLQNNYDANIVIVDYGKLTQSHLPISLTPYSILQLTLTFGRTELIAKRIAGFLQFLMHSEVLSGPEQVHILGFGVGAHIAGGVGRNVKDLVKKNIDRISGLDPSIQIPTRRFLLDKSDADYVDVTYTSTGSFALVRRRGHAQFFINGGRFHQPNCPNFAPFDTVGCSHTAANYFYAKTIQKSKKIRACRCFRLFCGSRIANSNRQCDDAELYGEYADRGTIGNFYVNYV